MIPRNKKNKHRFSSILKLIVFCGALIFSFTQTQAQESLNASNSIHILANQLDVQAYPNGTFDADKYQRELHTTKNRGFTDAYLVHRPFEKLDSQNHEYALSKG